MWRAHFATLLLPLLCAGCNSAPDSYPPPPQREPLVTPSHVGLSYFVSMSNPNANAYIVQGISSNTEGTGFRWAFEHPVLQFFVPPMDQPRFAMDFALPEREFRVTGPVVLTFLLNGKTFGRQRFDHPGVLAYDHEVPRDWIHADAVNQVAIEPDHVWTTNEGDKYAFVISRVGFVE